MSALLYPSASFFSKLFVRRAAKLACVALLASAGFAAHAQPAADPLKEGREPSPQTGVTGQSEAEEASPAPLQSLIDPKGTLKDAGISIGGWAEAGYTYSTSSPPDNVITGRAFDFENQDPTLHQVALFAERTTDASKAWDLGFRVEALFGADARFTHSNGLFESVSDGENQFDLTQAYGEVVIPVGNGIKTKIGKFITPLGYELVNPTGNAFYSHSYLFGILPFAHTGVLGTYQVGDNLSVSFGVSRGWDQALEDNNDDALDVIGVVAYTLDDKTNLTFSFTTGPEQAGNSGRYRTALDFIGTHQVTDKLTLAVNADYVFDAQAGQDGDDSSVYGVAGYVGYKVCECATVNGRLEWFNDTTRVGGFDANLYEATLGVAIKPINDGPASGLVIRPEVRWDYADNDVFDGGTDDQQLTFGVDAYITF